MKKVVRLTESDLTRMIRRVLKENEMDEMMDVSSDSEHYKARRREQQVPGDELAVLISFARKWCENSGYKMGGRLEDIGLSDCQTVADVNRRFSYL